MITTLTDALKGILGLNKQISEEEIECAIDEQTVDCAVMEEEPAYVGVPAPVLTPHDDWFEDPPKTEMQMEYEHINDDPHDGWWLRPEWQDQETKESPNIHQEMYEMATQSAATTLQLDPIGGSENFQGGSENVHR
jgi:hypothetical protein